MIKINIITYEEIDISFMDGPIKGLDITNYKEISNEEYELKTIDELRDFVIIEEYTHEEDLISNDMEFVKYFGKYLRTFKVSKELLVNFERYHQTT